MSQFKKDATSTPPKIHQNFTIWQKKKQSEFLKITVQVGANLTLLTDSFAVYSHDPSGDAYDRGVIRYVF